MPLSNKAIRTQIDDLGDIYAIESATDCSNLPDLARQEFRDDADVNKILARYGIDGARQRPVVFGERDTDMELSRAISMLKHAEATWHQMPPEIKQRFKTPDALVKAADTGELAEVLEMIKPKDPAEKPSQEATHAK